MASVFEHFRYYWKRYIFGTVATVVVGHYASKKVRENAVMRELCAQAKVYGDQSAGLYTKPRKVLVFLNPQANAMKARKQFNKYVAPLLHVSGMHVTIMESEYQGQSRTLMNYIDPQVDGIVVAGGDGTLLEVLNGLMRRTDAAQLMAIPIGVIPLGKENRFYTSRWHQRPSSSPARVIGNATMTVIKGDSMTADVMELQPEKGRTLYTLSSVRWGVVKEAYDSKDSFRLFRGLRLFFSCLNVALRKWPTDYWLHLWLPSQAGSHSTPKPPVDVEATPPHIVLGSNGASSFFLHLRQLFGIRQSYCISGPQLTLNTSESKEDPCFAHGNRLQHTGGCSHTKLDCTGFHLFLNHNDKSINLMVWPASLKRSLFLQHGWNGGQFDSSLPHHSFECSELIIDPRSLQQTWLSIDGEKYEATPIAIKVIPNAVKVFDNV